MNNSNLQANSLISLTVNKSAHSRFLCERINQN